MLNKFNENEKFINLILRCRKNLKNEVLQNNLLNIDNTKSAIITIKILSLWVISILILPFIYSHFGLLAFFINFILIGIFSYKITFLIHESCHNNLFQNKKVNDFFGNLAASIVGTTLNTYRSLHFEHHKYSNTKQDPQFEDSLGQINKILTKKKYLSFLISPLLFSKFFIYCVREGSFIINIFFNKTFEKKKMDYYCLVLTIIINLGIITYLSMMANSGKLAASYYLSLFTVSLLLTRIRTLAEHQYKEQDTTPAEYTVSHKENFIEKFFLYDMNFNYHLEHHIFPKIPHHNLKQFSKIYENSIHGDNKTLLKSMFMSIFKRFTAIKNL
jgi:fatty acid desaturase